MNTNDEQPYIERTEVITVTHRDYNPNYGDDRTCICGHSYYRHFDTYEQMSAVGCKYCQCFTFEERPEGMSEEEREMFEQSFNRPSNYFDLSHAEQWDIDKKLGILDWDGLGMTKEENERYRNHYNLKD